MEDRVREHVKSRLIDWLPVSVTLGLIDPGSRETLFRITWDEFVGVLRERGLSELQEIKACLLQEEEELLNELRDISAVYTGEVQADSEEEEGMRITLSDEYATGLVVTPGDVISDSQDEEIEHLALTKGYIAFRLSILRNVIWRYTVLGEIKTWNELSTDETSAFQRPKNRFETYLEAAAQIVVEERTFKSLTQFWQAVANESPPKRDGKQVGWQTVMLSFKENGVFQPNQTLETLYENIRKAAKS